MAERTIKKELNVLSSPAEAALPPTPTDPEVERVASQIDDILRKPEIFVANFLTDRQRLGSVAREFAKSPELLCMGIHRVLERLGEATEETWKGVRADHLINLGVIYFKNGLSYPEFGEKIATLLPSLKQLQPSDSKNHYEAALSVLEASRAHFSADWWQNEIQTSPVPYRALRGYLIDHGWEAVRAVIPTISEMKFGAERSTLTAENIFDAVCPIFNRHGNDVETLNIVLTHLDSLSRSDLSKLLKTKSTNNGQVSVGLVGERGDDLK